MILVKTPNKAETKNPTNGSTGQGEKSPPTDVPYGVIATRCRVEDCLAESCEVLTSPRVFPRVSPVQAVLSADLHGDPFWFGNFRHGYPQDQNTVRIISMGLLMVKALGNRELAVVVGHLKFPVGRDSWHGMLC